MASARFGSPTRSLVLGGGGAVGVGWQIGFLTGLRKSGIDLAGAEAIVGTSAGALVGALLAGGREVTDALAGLAALGQDIAPDLLASGNAAFLNALRQASFGNDPRQALRILGRASREATTPSRDAYNALFSSLDDIPWPAGFRCTSIDVETGDLVVWSQESGAALRDAVAASCCVPLLFPTVVIEGRHHMDGGVLSHLNLPAAPPSDVVVVLSCHPLGSPGDSALATSIAGANEELARLRDTARVLAIEADFSEIEAPPHMLMDPNLAVHALQIGERQALREFETIRSAWNS
ncbi:patatin-like phospholipase family protein [Amycolatopsis sp. NPDC101161]|uniref:patatin-like phospholipase family protein n=1 Tax=Amycolatopsis sp. NPDC101161 TaxID=3363940 RepID=UPI003816C727